MNEEQRVKRNRSNTESMIRNQKQIPLKYKKEVAEKIYAHAKESGTTPITWIKKAIAELYKRETGRDLDQ